MPKVEFFSPYEKALSVQNLDSFEAAMSLNDGTQFKKNKHRSVIKFASTQDGQENEFFLKRHIKPELKDKVRDLFSLRWPLSDARQELENIRAVAALGIPTMKPAGWGESSRGWLRRQSFLMTESLGDLERLENYLTRRFAKTLTAVERREKRRLIAAVAELVRRLHQTHLFHHDLYCGHILVKENGDAAPTLFLIDLQRVRRREWMKRRWSAKDLSALDYTADPRAISRADRLRFFFTYLGLALRPTPRLTPSRKRWIRAILRRTARTKRHTEKKRARYLVARS